MKKLKTIFDRDISFITRSPDQYKVLDQPLVGHQYKNFNIEVNIRDINDYEGSIVVFNDMLDSNQKLIDPFVTKGRQKVSDVYYLSQSFLSPQKEL